MAAQIPQIFAPDIPHFGEVVSVTPMINMAFQKLALYEALLKMPMPAIINRMVCNGTVVWQEGKSSVDEIDASGAFIPSMNLKLFLTKEAEEKHWGISINFLEAYPCFFEMMVAHHIARYDFTNAGVKKCVEDIHRLEQQGSNKKIKKNRRAHQRAKLRKQCVV